VLANFLDKEGVISAHIVGAKTGGAIAMQFAATYPQRTRSLIVANGPFSPPDPNADSSQQLRLGSSATKEKIAYFDKMKSATSLQTRAGDRKMLAGMNLDSVLRRITAPTLVITTDRSALQTLESVLHYQPKNSEFAIAGPDE
jgi:pimeloyl-ACP methyl ester carboxylesterase